MANIKKFTQYDELDDTLNFNFNVILTDNKNFVSLMRKFFKSNSQVGLLEENEKTTDFFEGFNLIYISNREKHIKNFKKVIGLVSEYNDTENFVKLIHDIYVYNIKFLSVLVALKRIKSNEKDLYNDNILLIDYIIKLNEKINNELSYIYDTVMKIIK